MKKKAAAMLEAGTKLVMVRDGSYSSRCSIGDVVTLKWRTEGSANINVEAFFQGHPIDQTIKSKDVELYEPAPELTKDDGTEMPEFKLVTGPCASWGDMKAFVQLPQVKPHTPLPHAELRKTWKEGQVWEFQATYATYWTKCSGQPEWRPNIAYRQAEVSPQTRRQQLIAAGVPADELAKIFDVRLAGSAHNEIGVSLGSAFQWSVTPQGYVFWRAWADKLNGKDVTMPEPLDAAVYCVVFAGTRICLEGGEAVSTLAKCKNTAKSMRRLFPELTYRVMRLTPA